MRYCHVSPRVGREFDRCAAVSAHELRRAALHCRGTGCKSQLVQLSAARSLLAFVLWQSRKIAVADDSIADQVTSQAVNSPFDSVGAMARSCVKVSEFNELCGDRRRYSRPLEADNAAHTSSPLPGSVLLVPFAEKASRALTRLELCLSALKPQIEPVRARGASRPPRSRQARTLRTRIYAFRNASRSALIVSACVVGMPWGKSL